VPKNNETVGVHVILVVLGEENTEDNVKTVTIEVREPST
jgi:hypothetical protein